LGELTSSGGEGRTANQSSLCQSGLLDFYRETSLFDFKSYI
jgi:hypothetical protein